MPKISVVIPTYNTVQYIGEALDSVYAQSYCDYEVIVVDDGSTDSTRERLEVYGKRLHYHYQPNQGLAVARNTGLHLAQGEYVTYLDADDRWHPDNLRIKAEVLKAYPDVGGVFSDFAVFNDTGVLHERGSKHVFPFFQRTGLEFDGVFPERHALTISPGTTATLYVGNVFEKLFLGNFILPTTMVFNRAYTEAVGDFRPHLRTQQDYEYWLRYSQYYRFAYIDTVLAWYRRHPQQLTDYSKIERIMLAVKEIVDAYEGAFTGAERRRIFVRRKSEILANLAKVYIRREHPTHARRLLAEGVRLDPQYLPSYFHFALSFVPYRLLAKVRALLSRAI